MGFPDELDPVLSNSTSSGGDWVSRALDAWATVEKTRQDNRLAQTMLQAQLWGIPSQYQNPQAKAGSYTTSSMMMNPLVIGLGVLLVGALVWKLAK